MIRARYDEYGRLMVPQLHGIATEREQADHRGMTPRIEETFVSCLCNSATLFHLRWSHLDDPDFLEDEPNGDDGTAICGRRRTRDADGFWIAGNRVCPDCLNQALDMAWEIGDLIEQ